MNAEETACFHTAGHAVLGIYFGMPVYDATVVPGDNPINQLSPWNAIRDRLPGRPLEKVTLWDSVRVMQLAAGRCAAGRVSSESRRLSRTSADEEALLNSLAAITGHRRDAVSTFLHNRLNALLDDPAIWSVVSEAAALLRTSGSAPGADIERAVRSRLYSTTVPPAADVLAVLHAFNDTAQARAAAHDGPIRWLGSSSGGDYSG